MYERSELAQTITDKVQRLISWPVAFTTGSVTNKKKSMKNQNRIMCDKNRMRDSYFLI
jgi:hypothetical protein